MEQQQQGQGLQGAYKIKPQSENVNYANNIVETFIMCENNNFRLFDQKEDEKQLDLRHCLVAIILENNPDQWVLAEVADCGDGPQVLFSIEYKPQSYADAGIVIQHLNKSLSGKYYKLLRDNCYSCADEIGKQFCQNYNGEAMKWCNSTIKRTVLEAGGYLGNKAYDKTKYAAQQAQKIGSDMFNKGLQMGQNFMKNVQQKK